MKVIVLGAGLVGGPMAIDLSQDSNLEVTVADISQAALTKLSTEHPSISTRCEDLSNLKASISSALRSGVLIFICTTLLAYVKRGIALR